MPKSKKYMEYFPNSKKKYLFLFKQFKICWSIINNQQLLTENVKKIHLLIATAFDENYISISQ